MNKRGHCHSTQNDQATGPVARTSLARQALKYDSFGYMHTVSDTMGLCVTFSFREHIFTSVHYRKGDDSHFLGNDHRQEEVKLINMIAASSEKYVIVCKISCLSLQGRSLNIMFCVY